VQGAGHYGIFAGRRWREVVYPQVKAFIARYQTQLKAKSLAQAKPQSGKRKIAKA